MSDGVSNWELTGARSISRAHNPRRFFQQYVAPLFYRWTETLLGRPKAHEEFVQENEFWEQSARLPFASVRLEGFRLSDWFPRAPGVYWSRFGIEARETMWLERTEDDPKLGHIFSPQAKMGLIEDGGIGTIRLEPRRIDETDYWLATAVKGQQCAGGVPLAIPDTYFRESKVDWGDTVNVVGRVRSLKSIGLDDTAASVHHANPILVMVDQIESVSRRQHMIGPIIVTPVALFEIEDEGSSREKFGYTFVQSTARDRDIEEARNWMQLYAQKYDGRVVTNFDELHPLLSDAPLSYQRLLKKNYERNIIERLYLNAPEGAILANRIDRVERVMSKISVTLGNGTVIHGDMVVATSIKNSFNRVKESSANPDIKDALARLTAQVGEMVGKLDPDAAKDVSDAVETLTKETVREKPRRSWWELSLNTIKSVASTAGEIGKPVLEAVAAVATLLAAVYP